MKNPIASLLLSLLVGSTGLAATAELHSQKLALSHKSPAGPSNSIPAAHVTAILDLAAK
jgi:hypothetical protein